MEVSNSLLVLVTMALLVLPPPALFAMTCSESRRSCDSSGMSRRRKTTSNRERRAEPILKIRKHHRLYESVTCRRTQEINIFQQLLKKLTSDFQRRSCLCCNVPQWGLQQLRRTLWQAERKLFRPSPDSQSAAPWLQVTPAADYPIYQTHQCSTPLKKIDRE